MSDNAQKADGSLNPGVVVNVGWVLDPVMVAHAVSILDSFDNQLTGLLAQAGNFFKLMDESNMASADMRWAFRVKVCEDYAERRGIERKSADKAWQRLMEFIKAQPQWAAFVEPKEPLSNTKAATEKRATREKAAAKPKDPRVEAANAEKARVDAEVAAEVKANKAKVKAAKEKINALVAKVSHSAELTESLLAAVETRYRELLAPAKPDTKAKAEAKAK